MDLERGGVAIETMSQTSGSNMATSVPQNNSDWINFICTEPEVGLFVGVMSRSLGAVDNTHDGTPIYYSVRYYLFVNVIKRIWRIIAF